MGRDGRAGRAAAGRVLRMALLACVAGFVLAVDYRAEGARPLFAAMLLGVAAWAGRCLWGDPGGDGAELREVDLPGREATFEDLVADIRRAAGGVHMLGLALDQLREDSGGGAAIVLAEVIQRRVAALERLGERREGPADG